MIRLTTEVAQRLIRFFEPILHRAASTPDEAMLQELVNAIDGQLNTPSHFDDLVDTIVKVVQEPRISSLNRDHLALLRRALLSPRELAKFSALMNKRQDCTHCGRRLLDYEAITIVSGNVRCYQCSTPMVIHCPDCEGTIDVSGVGKSLQRQRQRHTCAAPGANPAPEPESLWIEAVAEEDSALSSSARSLWETRVRAAAVAAATRTISRENGLISYATIPTPPSSGGSNGNA